MCLHRVVAGSAWPAADGNYLLQDVSLIWLLLRAFRRRATNDGSHANANANQDIITMLACWFDKGSRSLNP